MLIAEQVISIKSIATYINWKNVITSLILNIYLEFSWMFGGSHQINWEHKDEWFRGTFPENICECFYHMGQCPFLQQPVSFFFNFIIRRLDIEIRYYPKFYCLFSMYTLYILYL